MVGLAAVAGAIMWLVVDWDLGRARDDPFDAGRAWQRLGITFGIPTVLAAVAAKFRPREMDPSWPALTTAVACGFALAVRVVSDAHHLLQIVDSDGYSTAFYVSTVVADISNTTVLTAAAVLARFLWHRRDRAGLPSGSDSAKWARPAGATRPKAANLESE